MSTGITMKTFKKFVQDKKKNVPALLISQGKHSKEKKKEEVPSLMISQGKHSKPIKEETSHFSKLNDEANKHIGTASDTQDELHTRQPFANLKHDERHAIRKYTEDSHYLNKNLYHQHIDSNHEVPGSHLQHAEQLDRALNRYKLKEKLHVFSGVRFNPGAEASKNSERKIHLPAFTSTSIKPSIARGFADTLPHPNVSQGVQHIVRFNLPKGHNGLYIGTNSEHNTEHEFLLPRKTSWHISKTPEVHPHPYDDQKQVHIWDAHPAKNEEDENERQLKLDFKK